MVCAWPCLQRANRFVEDITWFHSQLSHRGISQNPGHFVVDVRSQLQGWVIIVVGPRSDAVDHSWHRPFPELVCVTDLQAKITCSDHLIVTITPSNNLIVTINSFFLKFVIVGLKMTQYGRVNGKRMGMGYEEMRASARYVRKCWMWIMSMTLKGCE